MRYEDHGAFKIFQGVYQPRTNMRPSCWGQLHCYLHQTVNATDALG